MRDWSSTDFESIAPDAVPVTAYKPIGDRYRYDCAYTDWGDADHPDPARDHYRIAWRRQAANTGERTLIPALIPPGAAHVDGVVSAASRTRSATDLVVCLGSLASLTSDFLTRAVPKGDIRAATINRLPYVEGPLTPELVLRTLRLNCVTDAYADLWSAAYEPGFAEARWALEAVTDTPLAAGPTWTRDTPLRIAEDRRRALVENDALVALMLGLSADELCTIYRTQFAVLYGYDTKRDHYDANGRLVPNSVLTVWRTKGERISAEERTATNQAGNTYVYELPFATLDREKDMRRAYEHFENLLAERGENRGVARP